MNVKPCPERLQNYAENNATAQLLDLLNNKLTNHKAYIQTNLSD